MMKIVIITDEDVIEYYHSNVQFQDCERYSHPNIMQLQLE